MLKSLLPKSPQLPNNDEVAGTRPAVSLKFIYRGATPDVAFAYVGGFAPYFETGGGRPPVSLFASGRQGDMTRDPGLEAQLLADLGQPEGLDSRPMFGGLCYMLNGHMLCTAREGRAMFRVGKQAEPEALAFPGTERMSQSGREKPGYVWLSAPDLSNNTIRQALALMALAHVSTFPPKDR